MPNIIKNKIRQMNKVKKKKNQRNLKKRLIQQKTIIQKDYLKKPRPQASIWKKMNQPIIKV